MFENCFLNKKAVETAKGMKTFYKYYFIEIFYKCAGLQVPEKKINQWFNNMKDIISKPFKSKGS